LEITEDLTIDGGTGVIVERSSAGSTPEFRIFAISGSDTEVTLNSLTIRKGSATGSFPANGGGGIRNDGTLTVTSSTITDNSAVGNGGGIRNTGTLQINGSTFSSNDSGFNGGGIYSTGNLRVTTSTLIDNTTTRNGGGIYCDNMGTVTVLSSTLNGNTADDFAGGIGQFNGELSIINSTITGNEARLGGGGVRSYVDNTMSVINSTINNNTISGTMLEGGGIRNEGPMTLYNTIVANSTGDVDVNNTGGTLNAASSTIVADGSLTAPGITDDNPQLGPLADNGGPTLTHLPQPGSPAINAGDNSIIDGTAPPVDINGDGTIDANDTLDTDQRDFARVIAETVDIGAVEVGAGDIAYSVAIAPTSISEGDSGTSDAQVTVTRSGAISSTSSLSITLGGTASEGSDYTFTLSSSGASFDAATGTLSFDAGTTEATFTLTVQGDSTVESDETVTVTLSNATAPESATLTTGEATLTITNDDTDDGGDGGGELYLPLVQR
jgi:predicted outer membrane repeat protein